MGTTWAPHGHLAFRRAIPHEGETGRVAEWFKAPVLKTGVPARVPWVRIPPLPPFAQIFVGLRLYALECNPFRSAACSEQGNFRQPLQLHRNLVGANQQIP